ncbi:amidase [gamma proteobacterium HTCC5015]|nr:amidase [gamma proteobacterium HTCC5015]
MTFTEYAQYDALGLGELVRKGEVSASELLEAAIARVDAVNPSLNAVIHRFDERARNAVDRGLPEGPFQGVPFVLKDLMNACAGEPLSMGSRGVQWVPPQDTTLAARYRSSGVNFFAKTNTPELGLIITTEPKAHGVAHNPWKSGYSTGGSSGGSAAAVASRMVPMASGGDGGGSIRFPSAWCGVFGLKPSRGRNPAGPDVGESWDGAATEHVLTRSVRDSAAMLDITAGYETGAPYHIARPEKTFLSATQEDCKPLRIALTRTPMVPGVSVDKDVLEALDQTAKQLESLGHRVEEAKPDIDPERFWRAFFVVVCAHTAATEQNIRRDFGDAAARQLEPSTKNMAMLGRSFKASDLVQAKQEWFNISRAAGLLLEQYDVMLCPTVPSTAVPHGVLPPSALDETLMTLSSRFNIGRFLFNSGIVAPMALPVLRKMAFTILGNISGLPAMSTPLAMSPSGLPIGMQFYGRMCDEHTLFGLAAQLEKAKLFTPLPK